MHEYVYTSYIQLIVSDSIPPSGVNNSENLLHSTAGDSYTRYKPPTTRSVMRALSSKAPRNRWSVVLSDGPTCGVTITPFGLRRTPIRPRIIVPAPREVSFEADTKPKLPMPPPKGTREFKALVRSIATKVRTQARRAQYLTSTAAR